MFEPKLKYIAATCASDGSMLIAGTSASGGRSVKCMGVCSASVGVRRELGFGLDFVLDGDGHAVAQLERAGTDHLLPGAHAVEDRDVIAARMAEPHELLACDGRGRRRGAWGL